MASGRRGGCAFPILLALFIGAVLTFDGGDDRADVEVRRPSVPEAPVDADAPAIAMPDLAPQYGIEDPGPPRDSQGTAFAIARNGLWLTAEHVVNGCNLLGLATAPDRAERVDRVVASAVSDAAIISDGLSSAAALPLSAHIPRRGDDGYHMGFPTGRPAVVHSRFIGEANAVRAGGAAQPILAWAEIDRVPAFDHTLGGISGGPTLDRFGRVVGINSASSDRRGRVLTTHPAQAINLVRATRSTTNPDPGAPIADMSAAAARFEALVRAGAIRQVFCEVTG
jgi:serine protease Do